MRDKRYENITLPPELDDVIDSATEKFVLEKKRQDHKIYKRTLTSIAAVIVAVLTLGITNPALAAKLPIIGPIFELIEKEGLFQANYSQYATPINNTVYSNGIEITLSEVVSDGESIYVTYCVTSNEPFENRTFEYMGEVYDRQTLTLHTQYSKVDFSENNLNLFPDTGVVGKYIDEKTFVGMTTYHLNFLTEIIPNEFVFKTNIFMVQDQSHPNDDLANNTYGEWKFEIPVKVDSTLKKQLNLEDIESNGASVDSITLTPFSTRVEVTLPDKQFEKYELRVFDETGTELWVSSGESRENRIDYKFEALPKDSSEIRIVIEKGIVDYATMAWEFERVVLDEVVTLEK